jgi:hypothetical protein
VQAERRSNAVTELVEVPSIAYAKAQPEIMKSEALNNQRLNINNKINIYETSL